MRIPSFQKSIFGLLVLVICLLSVYRFSSQNQKTNDGIEYHHSANNLLNHNTLYSADITQATDYRMYSKRTLGYPLFIVLQSGNRLILTMAQSLLVLLTFFISLRILRQFTVKTNTIKLFSVFFITYMVLLFHVFFSLSDLLLLAVFTVGFAVFYEPSTTANSKVLTLCILWSVALLVKPVILPSLLCIPLLWFWFLIKNKSFKWQMVFPIIIWAGSSLINKSNSNVFEYSSISEINLVQYNAKLTIAQKYGFDSAQAFVNHALEKKPHSVQEYKNFKKRSKEIGASAILKNPISYAKIQLVGMTKMLIDPGRFELFTFFNQSTSEVSLTEMLYAKKWRKLVSQLQSNYTLTFAFTILSILGVVKTLGFFISLLEWRRFWPILIVFLYTLLIVGPLGAARFLLPVGLIYITMSTLGFERLLDFFKKGSKS